MDITCQAQAIVTHYLDKNMLPMHYLGYCLVNVVKLLGIPTNFSYTHQAPQDVRLCFTDSIGSFGTSAPREAVSARWLVEHPLQDPGSDYGRQKRGCRELLRDATAQHGLDTRWAVVPGVLHTSPVWGAGTTEYALDAIAHAVRECDPLSGSTAPRPYACPVPVDAVLPMIHVDDLVEGLLALAAAPRSFISEPDGGWVMSVLYLGCQMSLYVLRGSG